MRGERGNRPCHDQALPPRGVRAALTGMTPVHDERGLIDTVVEEFLIGFDRQHRRHMPCRIGNHAVLRHDSVTLDMHAHATALWLCRVSWEPRRYRTHARSDFPRHPVIAEDASKIAQSAGFALDDEMPKRQACLVQEVLAIACARIEPGERLDRQLQRASKPPQSGGLLLRKLAL